MEQKTERTLADMLIAMLSGVLISTCWEREGWLFQAGLVWGGMCVGYLVTTFLDGDEQ